MQSRKLGNTSYSLGAATETKLLDHGHAQGLFGIVTMQTQESCDQDHFLNHQIFSEGPPNATEALIVNCQGS